MADPGIIYPDDFSRLPIDEQQAFERRYREYGQAAAMEYFNQRVIVQEDANKARIELQRLEDEERRRREGITDPTSPDAQDLNVYPGTTIPKLTKEQEEQFRQGVKTLRGSQRFAEPEFPGITAYHTKDELKEQFETIRDYKYTMGPFQSAEIEADRKAKYDAIPEYIKRLYLGYEANDFSDAAIPTNIMRQGPTAEEARMVRQERRGTLEDLDNQQQRTYDSMVKGFENKGYPLQKSVQESTYDALLVQYQAQNPGYVRGTDPAVEQELNTQAAMLAASADSAERRSRDLMAYDYAPLRARQAGDPYSMPPTPQAFRRRGSEMVGGQLQRDPESVRDMTATEAMFQALMPQTIMTSQEARDQDVAKVQARLNAFGRVSEELRADGVPYGKATTDQELAALANYFRDIYDQKFAEERQKVLMANPRLAQERPDIVGDYLQAEATKHTRDQILLALDTQPRDFYYRDQLLENYFEMPDGSMMAQIEQFAKEEIAPLALDVVSKELPTGELTESMGMAIIRDLGLPFRLINNPIEQVLTNMGQSATGDPNFGNYDATGQLYTVPRVELTEEVSYGDGVFDAYLKEVAVETATGYTMGNAFVGFRQVPASQRGAPGMDAQDQAFLMGTATEILIPYGTLAKLPMGVAKLAGKPIGKGLSVGADFVQTTTALRRGGAKGPEATMVRGMMPGPVKTTGKAFVEEAKQVGKAKNPLAGTETNQWIAGEAAETVAAIEHSKDILKQRQLNARLVDRDLEINVEASGLAGETIESVEQQALIQARRDATEVMNDLLKVDEQFRRDARKIIPDIDDMSYIDDTDAELILKGLDKDNPIKREIVGAYVEAQGKRKPFANEAMRARATEDAEEFIRNNLNYERPFIERTGYRDIIDEEQAFNAMSPSVERKVRQLIVSDDIGGDELARKIDRLEAMQTQMAQLDNMYGEMTRIVLREGGLRYGKGANTAKPLTAAAGVKTEAAAARTMEGLPIEPTTMQAKPGSAASFEQLVEAGAERLAGYNLENYFMLTDRMAVHKNFMGKHFDEIRDGVETELRPLVNNGGIKNWFESASGKTIRRDAELQRIINKVEANPGMQNLTPREEVYLTARYAEMKALKLGNDNRADLFFTIGEAGQKLKTPTELRGKGFVPANIGAFIAAAGGEPITALALAIIANPGGRAFMADFARAGYGLFSVKTPAQFMNSVSEAVGSTRFGKFFGFTGAPVYAVNPETAVFTQTAATAKKEVAAIQQVAKPTARSWVNWAKTEFPTNIPGLGAAQSHQMHAAWHMTLASQTMDPTTVLTGMPHIRGNALTASGLEDLARLTFGTGFDANDAAAIKEMALAKGFSKIEDGTAVVSIETPAQYIEVMDEFLIGNKRLWETAAKDAGALDHQGVLLVAAFNGAARRRVESVMREGLALLNTPVNSKTEGKLILSMARQRIENPSFNPYLLTKDQLYTEFVNAGYNKNTAQKYADYFYMTGDTTALQQELPGLARLSGAIQPEDRLRAFFGNRDVDLANKLRAGGLSAQTTPTEFAQQIGLAQSTILNDDYIILAGAKSRAALEELKTMLGDPKALGQLATGFEQLNRDVGLRSQVQSMLGLTMGDVRRSIVSGQLGGKYLPNVPYHAENIITAPFLAQITLDSGPTKNWFVKQAVKTPVGAAAEAAGFRPVAREGQRLSVDLRTLAGQASKNPDDLVPGSIYTYRQVQDGMNRLNLGSSNGALQLSDVFLNELRGAVSKESSFGRAMLSHLDDITTAQAGFRTKKMSPYMNFAQETDMYMRRQMYYLQIQQGKTIEQAADIARVAFLDYGDLPPIVKKAGARGFLYLSFTYRTAYETLAALMKPNAFYRLGKMANAQRAFADYYGAYQFAGDKTLPSFFLTGDKDASPEERYVQTYYRNPWIQNMMMFAQVGGFAANMYEGDPEATYSMAFDNMLDFFYLPGLEIIRDLDPDYKKGVPPKTMYKLLRNQAQAGNLPGYELYFGIGPVSAEGSSLYDFFNGNPRAAVLGSDIQQPAAFYIDRYDLEVRPVGSKIPGSPEFSNYQYRFASQAGYNAFRLDAFAMTALGAKRIGDDITGALIASGQVPPGTTFGYLEAGTPVFYMLGRQRPVRVPKEMEVRDRQIRQSIKILKELEKTYGYKGE